MLIDKSTRFRELFVFVWTDVRVVACDFYCAMSWNGDGWCSRHGTQGLAHMHQAAMECASGHTYIILGLFAWCWVLPNQSRHSDQIQQILCKVAQECFKWSQNSGKHSWKICEEHKREHLRMEIETGLEFWSAPSTWEICWDFGKGWVETSLPC